VINQKEIAEKAGVSPATVSRVFTQSASVSPKTLVKIQRAMISLGLDPVPVNSRSVTGKSGYVMIIAGDIANDFYAKIIKGLCDKLQETGILCVICNSHYDFKVEEEKMRFAQENGFLGVVLITAVDDENRVNLMKEITIPVILVNRYIRSMDTDIICIDNYMGGYMAASYLLLNNHKKIAHLAGNKDSTPQQDRVRGFAEAIYATAQTGVIHDVYYGEQTTERGHQFAKMIASKEVPYYSAVFAPDWHIALGFVITLKNMGYRVPEDISVICFDDSPFIDECALNLTTVKYDPYMMGCSTAETLLHRIENSDSGRHHLLLTPQLMERSSVRDLLEHTTNTATNDN